MGVGLKLRVSCTVGAAEQRRERDPVDIRIGCFFFVGKSFFFSWEKEAGVIEMWEGGGVGLTR